MFGLDSAARDSCAAQLSKLCLHYKWNISRKFDNTRQLMISPAAVMIKFLLFIFVRVVHHGLSCHIRVVVPSTVMHFGVVLLAIPYHVNMMGLSSGPLVIMPCVSMLTEFLSMRTKISTWIGNSGWRVHLSRFLQIQTF